MLKKLGAIHQNISPNLRKILGNISWLLADRFLRMVVGFFMVAWMARYLGTSQFGLLNFAIALLAIFGTIASLGVDHIVFRDLVNESENRNEIIGTAFILKLLGGLLGLALTAITIYLMRPGDRLSHMIVIIVAASLIFHEFLLISSWYQSKIESRFDIWAKNTALIMMAQIKVALIQFQAPLVAFAWAYCLENALVAFLLVIVYQGTKEKIQKWRFSWARAVELMRISWPLIFSNIAIMVYVRIDQVMLGQMAGDDEVGIYSAALKISESWLFLLLAIINSVKPSIIAAKKVSDDFFYEKMQKVCSFLALIVYSVALPMSLLATPIIVLVYGKEYAPAGIVLAVHIWSSLFTSFGMIKDVWIAVEEHTKFAVWTSSAGALLNIMLNWFLIPINQSLGAAIATVISYIFTDYLVYFCYPPAYRIGIICTKALTLRKLNLANLSSILK